MWDNGAHGSNSNQTQISLNPSQYRDRIPFFGVENTPRTVSYSKWCEDHQYTYYENISITIDGNSQTVMDQEIAYAYDAGIDYFAFNKYGADFYSYNLYKSSTSPYKSKVKFTYITGVSTPNSDLDYIALDFQRSDYQKIAGGRPLLYVDYNNYEMSSATADAYLASMRSYFQNNYPSVGNPYLVVLCYGCQSEISNADAFSQYTTEPGGKYGDFSFEYISTSQRNGWQSVANSKNVVPWISVGYDRRPRIDFTVDWERDSTCNAQHQYNHWGETASLQQITNEIIAAKNFITNNPSKTPANTMLIYAWNEHDEGGWICPTIVPGTSNIDRSRLDAVKAGINNTSETCSTLSDGLVMGTWTVTGHQLIARYFHNSWWLVQKINNSPEQFIVRGSEMLNRPDVTLNSSSYSNFVNCFSWQYSDYGGLMPPSDLYFPAPPNYVKMSENGDEFYQLSNTSPCSSPSPILASISNPLQGQSVTLSTSCTTGTPVWSTSYTGNSITVTATNTPQTYSVTCQGANCTNSSSVSYVVSSSSCTDQYLSNNWTSATSGYLTVQLGKNVGGYDISIGGVNYSNTNPGTGIGTHANSEVIYNLGSHNYNYFKAVIGKEDGSMGCGDGRLIFKVYDNINNNLLFTSTTIGDPSFGFPSHQSITVDITGVTSLKLVVENGDGPSTGCLWGTWAIARLSCSNSGARHSNFNDITYLELPKIVLTPNPIVNNSEIKFNFPSAQKNTNYLVRIISSDGNELLKQNMTLDKENNTIKLKNNKLSAGTYILNVLEGIHTYSTKIMVLK